MVISEALISLSPAALSTFRSKAPCPAVETGLFTSEVLSTFANPTIVLLIPETVPVNVGEAKFAFKSKAVVVAAVVANALKS